MNIQEPALRATKHIPKLQQLQQRLYDRFHHRFNAQEVSELTLGDFLDEMKHKNGNPVLSNDVNMFLINYLLITFLQCMCGGYMMTCFQALNGRGS